MVSQEYTIQRALNYDVDVPCEIFNKLSYMTFKQCFTFPSLRTHLPGSTNVDVDDLF